MAESNPINLDQTLAPLPTPGTDDNTIATVLSTLFGVLGAVAFLIIVIAGLRYMVANGDPSSTAKARNTIIYALVGLAVAVSGYAIVTFVVKGLV